MLLAMFEWNTEFPTINEQFAFPDIVHIALLSGTGNFSSIAFSDRNLTNDCDEHTSGIFNRNSKKKFIYTAFLSEATSLKLIDLFIKGGKQM